MTIKPGDLFRFPHPVSQVVEIFEVTNCLPDAKVELKAITGDYPNDLSRTVAAHDVDLRRHRLLNRQQINLLRDLSERPQGVTISGNRSHADFQFFTAEDLIVAKAVALDSVQYTITDTGRRALAEQAPIVAQVFPEEPSPLKGGFQVQVYPQTRSGR